MRKMGWIITLQDSGLLLWLRYAFHGSMGDSWDAKVYVWPPGTLGS